MPLGCLIPFHAVPTLSGACMHFDAARAPHTVQRARDSSLQRFPPAPAFVEAAVQCTAVLALVHSRRSAARGGHAAHESGSHRRLGLPDSLRARAAAAAAAAAVAAAAACAHEPWVSALEFVFPRIRPFAEAAAPYSLRLSSCVVGILPEGPLSAVKRQQVRSAAAGRV